MSWIFENDRCPEWHGKTSGTESDSSWHCLHVQILFCLGPGAQLKIQRTVAKALTKYPERGQDYVDALRSLMKTNMLMQTDDAYPDDGPTILLIPVGEGS